MTNIVACIDGSAVSSAVCDAGSWVSKRSYAPLNLLHVLDKALNANAGNLSRGIGGQVQSLEHLAQDVAVLDSRRNRLLQEHGGQLLEQAQQKAQKDGAVQVTTQQLHAHWTEILLELEINTRVFVMGRTGEGQGISSLHTLGSPLENAVRSLHRPILVVGPNFLTPKRFMIAYDASATSEKALAMVSIGPLLKGLPCHIVMVEKVAQMRHEQLKKTCEKLVRAGFDVICNVVEGDVRSALNQYQKDHQIDLMVIGAYGHSHVRRFCVGSNTTMMINTSQIPLLVLR